MLKLGVQTTARRQQQALLQASERYQLKESSKACQGKWPAHLSPADMLNYHFHRKFATDHQLFIHSSSTHTGIPNVSASGVTKKIQF